MKRILSSKWGKIEICAGIFNFISILGFFLALTISNTKFLNHNLQAQENTATVATNQADYAAGDMAIITGSGWQPGETVTLEIARDPIIAHDSPPDTVYAVADDAGNIYYEYIIPGYDVVETFTLTATGQVSVMSAQTTFTNSEYPIMETLSPEPTETLPTVMTDKLDYVPGETVLITGSGWEPGETVQLVFVEDPPIHDDPDTLYPIAHPEGNIFAEYVVQLNDLGQFFTLTATGLSSGLTALTTFTDANVNCTTDQDCLNAGLCEKCKASSGKCNSNDAIPSGSVCRPSAGSCDVQETCNGTDLTCPTDGFSSSSTVCRAAVAGGCDVAENCTGSGATCPTDAFVAVGTECRAAVAGGCDVAESCTGIATCPTDAFVAAGTACTADSNECTDDECDGSGTCAHNNNTVSCNDSDACTTGDTCSGGSCVGGAPTNCDDGNGCTDDSCNSSTGCVNTNNTASCDDGDACTTPDTCSGGVCSGTAQSASSVGDFLSPVQYTVYTRKLNSSIPFQFMTQVCDSLAGDLLSSGLVIKYKPVTCGVGDYSTPNMILPASMSTNGKGLWYVPDEDKYKFVLNTKTLAVGCYNFQASYNGDPYNNIVQIKVK